MNILFLTLLDFSTIEEPGIYTDLMRTFVNNNHHVCIISPYDRRERKKNELFVSKQVKILKLKIGNTQKTNVFEKGISTLLLESQFRNAIKKYFGNEHFDLILYSTPPITFHSAIKYVKQRDNAFTYLMLKDIFPQNAIDLGMLTLSGVKGLIYKHFRKKEKLLYAISDKIGCMSQANVEYIKYHNPEIEPSKLEICPNCIETRDLTLSFEKRIEMRNTYGLPLDKRIFVYGGNLGKPQDIPYIIECLKKRADDVNLYFLIIGNGTEYSILESFVNTEKPKNVKLMNKLPRGHYDEMIASCDVGLIFLDHRFTIPNFPSRLLSYLQAGLPVLACTDKYTDLGKVIVDGGFGWWCESNITSSFNKEIDIICMEFDEFVNKGKTGRKYLEDHYKASVAYDRILKSTIARYKV